MHESRKQIPLGNCCGPSSGAILQAGLCQGVEMGIADHLTCLLRNLYAGQEATVRTWNNRLVPNRKRSTRLYIVTLLI